ncbi:MAG TPA: type II secretion system F family protein [Vicinamibacteria bacterium]|jgi:type IV pilus assembly protein PilC|nr:type II secretion system F family protein [Vicinamibacteria bacterium]
MEYVCKVGTPTGEVVERTFAAPDETALRADLEQQGYYLFSIHRGLGLGRLRLRRPRVAPSLLLIFAQELAALLKAGLPLFQSLDVTLDRQKDPVFRRSLTTVREKVKSGTAISEAFRAEGDLYPPIFAASLVAGERSGSLESVLRRFSQHLRLNQGLKKKAVSASVYPIVLLSMMLLLVAVLVVYVIPQFKGFYEGLGAELPMPTQILLGVSDAVSSNLLWIGLVLAGGGVALWSWLQRPTSGLVIDRALLRLPYLGGLVRMYATSQLMRTLSTLLAGGLPLLNALEVAAASIGNRAMAGAVAAATPRIREGASLTASLESTGMLETLPLEMVKVGEQTGALGDMLNAVAEFYDEELDTRIATVLTLVEPILLVLMAVIVAGMLLAFYLPMFQAISAVQKTR